jgi:DNA polymerase III sliding clamp (beta) subunit (PCNA family)
MCVSAHPQHFYSHLLREVVMTFTIDSKKLKKSLAAYSFLPKGIPVAVTLTKDTLTISGGTNEIRVMHRLSGKTDVDGKAELDVVLTPIMGTLKSLDGEVQVVMRGNYLFLEHGDKSYKVRGEEVGNSVKFSGSKANGFRISASLLKRAFAKTKLFVASMDRPHFSGVHLAKTENGVQFIGTDGFTLSRYSVNVPLSDDVQLGLTIPPKLIDCVSSIDATEFEVYLSDDGDTKTVGFRFDDGVVEGSLIQLDFPAASTSKIIQIAMNEAEFTVVAVREPLMAMVKRNMIYGSQESPQIDIGVSRDEFRIYSQDVMMQTQAFQWLPQDNSQLDDKIMVCVNPEFLMKILKVIDSENVVFSFARSREKAIICRPSEEMDEKLELLIMPIRIDENEVEQRLARLFGEEHVNVAA